VTKRRQDICSEDGRDEMSIYSLYSRHQNNQQSVRYSTWISVRLMSGHINRPLDNNGRSLLRHLPQSARHRQDRNVDILTGHQNHLPDFGRKRSLVKPSPTRIGRRW